MSRLLPPNTIPHPQQKLDIVRKHGSGELPRLQMLSLTDIDIRYATLSHVVNARNVAHCTHAAASAIIAPSFVQID